MGLIEEKAKRYDETIERAKKVLLDCTSEEQKVVEYITPELCESEDERIRQWLIGYFNQYIIDGMPQVFGNGLNVKDVIAWLEKQGKDTLEDAIFDSNEDGLIAETIRYKNEKQGEQKPAPILDIEIPFGANDSELLEESIVIPKGCYATIEGNRVVIKRGEQKPNYCHHEVDLSGCSEEYRKAYYDGWNNCNQQHAQLDAEQKPAWSEEDEMFVHGLIRGLAAKKDIHGHTTFSSDCIDITETIDWLKSLKDRVLPKPAEWSEDVEAAISLLKDIAEEQEKDYCPYNANDLRKAAQYLETCRPQNRWKPSDEQMEALDDFIYAKYPNIEKYGAVVKSLYQDLKKLREE